MIINALKLLTNELKNLVRFHDRLAAYTASHLVVKHLIEREMWLLNVMGLGCLKHKRVLFNVSGAHDVSILVFHSSPIRIVWVRKWFLDLSKSLSFAIPGAFDIIESYP